MIETPLNKVLNTMRQYVENIYEHDSEPMLNWKDIKLVLDEIERLNNIINELEKILEYEKNDYVGNIDIETHNIDSEFLRGNSWEADYILTKLKELKEGK